MNDSRDVWITRWMNEYGDRLLQFVGGYTHDYQAAQDIVQEVFVRLYREHQKTAPNTLHAGWLYTVARRLAIDFHRRSPPAPVASIPEATTDGSHDLTLEVENVLDALSNLDREMLLLFYYQEWTVAQLADHYAIPLDTVKSRLHRARERFRRHWTEEGTP